jgi:hypothetical protein
MQWPRKINKNSIEILEKKSLERFRRLRNLELGYVFLFMKDKIGFLKL